MCGNSGIFIEKIFLAKNIGSLHAETRVEIPKTNIYFGNFSFSLKIFG